MAFTEILGKDVQLTIEGTDTNTFSVEGVSSVTLGKDYTDSDTSTNDSDGAGESLPTKIGRTIDLEGKRLEDSSGSLTTGQELLDSYSDAVGHDAVKGYTLSTQAGDGVAKSFDAWVEFGEPIGGDHESHVTWTATLHVNGTVSSTTA